MGTITQHSCRIRRTFGIFLPQTATGSLLQTNKQFSDLAQQLQLVQLQSDCSFLIHRGLVHSGAFERCLSRQIHSAIGCQGSFLLELLAAKVHIMTCWLHICYLTLFICSLYQIRIHHSSFIIHLSAGG